MVTEMKNTGLQINDEALALALSLEAENHVLSVRDGRLLVTNGSTLTPAQRDGIARHRLHLMAIAGYQAPEVVS